jgi:hypothetical protein
MTDETKPKFDEAKFHEHTDALCDMGFSMILFDNEGGECLCISDTAFADKTKFVSVGGFKTMCVGWMLRDQETVNKATSAIRAMAEADINNPTEH